MGEAYVAMVTQRPDAAARADAGVRRLRRPRRPRGDARGLRQAPPLRRDRVRARPQAVVASWFAHGMLLNVVAAMDLWSTREPWARRLLEGAIGAERARGARDAGS